MKPNHAERPLENHPIVEAWDSIELLEVRVSALEDAVIDAKEHNRLLAAMNETLIGVIKMLSPNSASPDGLSIPILHSPDQTSKPLD